MLLCISLLVLALQIDGIQLLQDEFNVGLATCASGSRKNIAKCDKKETYEPRRELIPSQNRYTPMQDDASDIQFGSMIFEGRLQQDRFWGDRRQANHLKYPQALSRKISSKIWMTMSGYWSGQHGVRDN